MANTKTFEASNLQTKRVTVYSNCAEVQRIIGTTLKKGVNEIIIVKMAESIDPCSIRVEAGSETRVIEIKTKEDSTENGLRSDNEKQMDNKLNQLRLESKKIEQEIRRLKKEREILDGYADSITSLPSGTSPKKNGRRINEIDVNKLNDFLKFYDGNSKQVDDKMNDAEKRLKETNDEIQMAKNNLDKMFQSGHRSLRIQEISVKLNAQTDDCSVELFLFYIVSNASWKPSYDIKIFTDKNDYKMKVCYNAAIKQNTNENWKDADVALSAGAPMSAKCIPKLKPLDIGFKSSKMVNVKKGPSEPQESVEEEDVESDAYVQSYSISVCRNVSESSWSSAASVSDDGINTLVNVSQRTDIQADNLWHKITVAEIDLTPSFEYKTIPIKSPHVYKKAIATNGSQYTFFSGPTLAFVDGNFVSKGFMKTVSPFEEFACFLGVEPAICVKYKPPVMYFEESGIISISSYVVRQQAIEIKNTKPIPVKIFAQDQIPRSVEDNLTITLLEPKDDQLEAGGSFSIDKTNNVEWAVDIAANETRELVLKYQLEYPNDVALDYEFW